MIRTARDSDAVAIHAIYAPHVSTDVATFETALPGAASVALHEALGFAPVGVWRQAGWKLGRWHDVGVWQKTLQAPASPPALVRSFASLTDVPDLRRALQLG